MYLSTWKNFPRDIQLCFPRLESEVVNPGLQSLFLLQNICNFKKHLHREVSFLSIRISFFLLWKIWFYFLNLKKSEKTIIIKKSVLVLSLECLTFHWSLKILSRYCQQCSELCQSQHPIPHFKEKRLSVGFISKNPFQRSRHWKF